ncbi:MAG TPA: rhodanese-like domain-containing protein [Gemmatimonadaceae bacterium]|nr:rhodanese-like domain-containing protein [Gemmatimonadaceae bacterium]
MSKLITREELRQKIERGDPLAIFEVLPTMYWRKHHLPGALSLPPEQVAELVPTVVPDKSAEIVLYCWDRHCPTSAAAARTLEELGYLNVHDYKEGKVDWMAAGLPMERPPKR